MNSWWTILKHEYFLLATNKQKRKKYDRTREYGVRAEQIQSRVGEARDSEAEGQQETRDEAHLPPAPLGHQRVEEQGRDVADERPQVEDPGHVGRGRPELEEEPREQDAEAGAGEVDGDLKDYDLGA